jgi:hypothetical protein
VNLKIIAIHSQDILKKLLKEERKAKVKVAMKIDLPIKEAPRD